MRNNQPVTQQETVIPEGEFIYSRTNLKGVIEEANEAFAKISGFTREEMIGQPHNIVRHPDMPVEAFADLWSDLKAGMPVSLLLRPDDVQHDDDSPMQAEVVSKAFRGAEFLYTLRLPGGAEVLALLPSQHDHAPGERIGLRLDVDSVTGFAAGG